MARQRVISGLVVGLVFACVVNAGFAQTPATTSNGTQTSGNEGQSAAAMAQEASNPFASSWALQLQQNNNWTEMPRGGHFAALEQPDLLVEDIRAFFRPLRRSLGRLVGVDFAGPRSTSG